MTRSGEGGGLRVLIACEASAVVRDAFRARGFDAWSCDLKGCEGDPRWHIQGDAIRAAYGQPWALMIAHPECTYLANSGAKHLYAGMNKANGPSPERWAKMGAAAAFFRAMLDAPIDHIAVENPVMLGHPKALFGIPEATQFIQPWMFGHGETKATGWWLKNLPALRPTDIVEGRANRVHREPPGPERKANRSRTLAGCAGAYADQWGGYVAGLYQQREAA